MKKPARRRAADRSCGRNACIGQAAQNHITCVNGTCKG